MLLRVLFVETESWNNNRSNDECDSTNELKEFYDQQKFCIALSFCCTSICKPFKMNNKVCIFPINSPSQVLVHQIVL
jgi:hypothetical protein